MRREEDPKFIEKRKKFYAKQKAKSQQYSKGGLSPKQKVIAAKAPPPDKITGEDFAALKKEKAGKVKPIKAVLGIAAMGLMGAKMLKDKNKKAMALPGVGAAALMAKKKKEILGKKTGGMGQATEYKKYLKGLKKATDSVKKDKANKFIKSIGVFPKINKKMGGGMIGGSQMPGYKTGTSVKARGCKLGRSKPTKMY
jgi:hypothetical protein